MTDADTRSTYSGAAVRNVDDAFARCFWRPLRLPACVRVESPSEWPRAQYVRHSVWLLSRTIQIVREAPQRVPAGRPKRSHAP